ncbi:SDR family NAD(P)-dependent oxidoreductase [Halobacillus yeomjeoni]|uniref:SDR family oxidoreductase n=1 Tax=Halobacillus yeomjeoni TaxID=311194 RepID=A0A931HYR3_9BACI|nr:SDR family oxidoreductase [Halobacillus yeomjeoni]MBH0231656.1 SDR family oxidoreductase [Halobacillus yeomjeoni]
MALFSNDAFKSEHILITGATGGIGYETAVEAAAMGAKLTITGRNEEKLHKLKDSCANLNEKAEIFVCPADLNDSEDRERLLKDAKQTFGPVTGLVNSAGIAGGDSLDRLSEEKMRKMMELNYFSTVLLTQGVYEQMKEIQRGAVVNVSSLSGLRGIHSNIAYSASKFAVIGFTQSFAVEAIEHGIRVNAVCPGFVDTEMGRSAIAGLGERNGNSYEEQRKLSEQGIPSGRISEADEVARSIIFLLSNASENIVGESLKISGGSVMR